MSSPASVIKDSLNRFGERISEDGLIRFDYRVLLFLGLLLALFVLCLTFRINFSSIGQWDYYMPDEHQESSGLLLGFPKVTRSDEWLRNTPYLISQHRHGFPIINDSLGSHNDPLLLNTPVRHFSTFFKPQDWGYFIFDIERGFSFYWAYKVFGLITSFSLLLLLLTRNRFWLSLTGTLWLYLSASIQWWFSVFTAEMLIAFFVVFISLVYVLQSERKPTIAFSALLLAVFSVDFILIFYPPFEIPLSYLLLFLLAGLLLQRGRLGRVKEHWLFRVVVLCGVAITISLTMGYFYRDAESTIKAIAATVYPGTRVSSGGSVNITEYFSGFTLVPYDDNGFPRPWGNASEASNFIFLFPLVIVAAARNLYLKRRNSTLIYSLSVFAILISVWILWGTPLIIAKLSLMSFSTAERAILPLGVCSIILTMVFLSNEDRADRVDRRFAVATAAGVFILLIFYGFLLKDFDAAFFRYRYLLLLALVFSAISYFLLSRRYAMFSLTILITTGVFTILVNPISTGMDAILDKQVYKTAYAIESEYPDSRWLAYGGNTLATFLKSSGMHVMNGIMYTPDLEFHRALDSQGEYEDIYNRYGNSVFMEAAEDRDPDVEYSLIFRDTYAVLIDPCSPKLEELGITNFAFSYRPIEEKNPCLELMQVVEDSNVWFYGRKDRRKTSPMDSSSTGSWGNRD